jgi:hypothetical protein
MIILSQYKIKTYKITSTETTWKIGTGQLGQNKIFMAAASRSNSPYAMDAWLHFRN